MRTSVGPPLTADSDVSICEKAQKFLRHETVGIVSEHSSGGKLHLYILDTPPRSPPEERISFSNRVMTHRHNVSPPAVFHVNSCSAPQAIITGWRVFLASPIRNGPCRLRLEIRRGEMYVDEGVLSCCEKPVVLPSSEGV